LLLPAIPLGGLRVLHAVPPRIIGIARAPFLRTIQAYLAVFRIRGDLLPVIFGAAPQLAGGIAAHPGRICSADSFTICASTAPARLSALW
jgi:hypothetical protein